VGVSTRASRGVSAWLGTARGRLGFGLLAAPLLLGLGSDTLYYRSQRQADSALDRFGRNHPQCELWTNWQKMCSRTGTGGEATCTVDRTRPVKPSRPFCLSAVPEGEARTEPVSLSGSEGRSMRRFCSPEAAATSPTGAKVEECGFDRTRPFNGYRLQARLHGWCAQWNEAVTRKPVCRVGKGGLLPSCENLAETGYESTRGFHCAEAAVPSWCAKAEGLGIEHSQVPGADFLPVADRQEGFPVRGVYCGERR